MIGNASLERSSRSYMTSGRWRKRKEAVRRFLDKVSLVELLTKFGVLNLTHPS